MPGPWEKYASPPEAAAGPWSKYAEPTADPVDTSTWQSLAHNPITDVVAGMGSGLISTGVGAYDLARKIPGASDILPEVNPTLREASKAPDTFMGKTGKFLEQGAEFMIPAGAVGKATKGASLFGRAAAQAGVGGAVAGLQSGGDPASAGTGAALGAAGPLVGGAASAASSKVAPALYHSALKPTWTMFKKEGQQLIDTGLGLKIPVSGEGAATLDAHIQDLRNQINQGIDANAKAGRTVDSSKVVQSLDGLKDWARNTVDPKPKLQAIQDLQDSFIDAHGSQIPLDKAQRLKINTYQELKKSYGEMKGVEIEAKKQLARGLKEQISDVFPEVAGLNEQQSKALGLDDALARAVWREHNKDVMGIGLPIAVGAAHELLGGPGALITIMGKIMGNPAIKSRLAIALASKGVANPSGTIAMRMAGALTKAGAVGALGESEPQQTEQPTMTQGAPAVTPQSAAMDVPDDIAGGLSVGVPRKVNSPNGVVTLIKKADGKVYQQ